MTRTVGEFIGTRIGYACQDAGLTVEDLETRADLQRGAVALIKQGSLRPTAEQILTIADALGISVVQLFGDDPR